MAGVHASIGDIWLDVSVRESHALAAKVTEHPVESGVDIADHVRPEPRTIAIEGLVTNHPIELPPTHVGSARENTAPIAIEGELSLGAFGNIPGANQGAAILGALRIEVRSKVELSAQALHFTEPFDRVAAVYSALTEIVETSKLVTVVTGLAVYDSVALTDLSFDRSPEVGPHMLRFSATGRVLRIVQSETARLPDPVDVRAKPAKSKGKQATTETKPESIQPAAKSALLKGKDWAVNLARSLLGGGL